MNFIMIFLMFPTLCFAGFFGNYTNLVTYRYSGMNCIEAPVRVDVSNTISCIPYQNISVCCKHLIEKSNDKVPLNSCYNKNGNSSFTSCFEQELTEQESVGLGILAIMGIFLIIIMTGSLLYGIYYCVFCGSTPVMYRNYESMN